MSPALTRVRTPLRTYATFFARAEPEPSSVPATGHVPTPRPPDQCSRRQNTCCSGASNTETDTGDGLCSTEQAPESLNLCCHSLPSGGLDRSARGQVPNPLVRAHIPAVSGSGNGAWAGMLRGINGMKWGGLHRFAHITMCRVGHPCGGAPETPPGDLGAGVRCSLRLG